MDFKQKYTSDFAYVLIGKYASLFVKGMFDKEQFLKDYAFNERQLKWLHGYGFLSNDEYEQTMIDLKSFYDFLM